ncbi:hypothetical protein AB6A40_000898 [Gnathostoma spinigerum]|uniref:Ferredoxin n=1 Tax=Gnathostoma spinigerum TaxID=75299 RepID=A0ABD6E2Z1_9BILA
MFLRNIMRIALCPRSVLSLCRTLTTTATCSTPQIKVKYVTGEGTFEAMGNVGDTLLDVVVNADLPLDGFGACEGCLACCTCHVILSKEHFDRTDKTNPVGEDENDLLDLAPEVCDLSRLGCQVKLTEEDAPEVTVTVPSERRDLRNMD